MALRDVIGQDKAVTILLRTIQRGRIPSSYLFAGESGIGKKFTALNLAKALNCQKTGTSQQAAVSNHKESERLSTTVYRLIDCCDECASCKKIDSVVHPDFLLISPEDGQIRIEEIRAIHDALVFKPFEGRWKVVIVDDADTMNPFAANAFLKTLEEPTKDSLIILISPNPDRLPDTIRSRCSRVNFTPLSHEDCERVIRRVIGHQSLVRGQKKDTKRLGTDDSRLSTMVSLSMGRPGFALSTDLIEERERFLKLLQEMLEGNKDGWASKEEMERWFDFMALFLREAAIIKIAQDEKNLINRDLKNYIMKLSVPMDLEVIVESYQKLMILRGYLRFNLNKSLTWNYTGSLLRKAMNSSYA